ncbi:MAG TPA: hypothetical protein VMT54_17015 [Candidatus Cybelea sp.]|nr:hypothetical protein [Candidatus Cybelea sp.]
MPWLRACLLLVLGCNLCLADPTLTLRDLEFRGWLASKRAGDPATVYTLLGTGFYAEPPATDDAEQVVAAWIAAHPDASVTVVDRALVVTADVRSWQAYVWVADGAENLNLALVRQGVFPAAVMTDGVAYLGALPNIDKTSDTFPKRLVADADYAAFAQRAREAEALARQEKLGIWADAYKDRRQAWGIE